jgi:hypothetical protein
MIIETKLIARFSTSHQVKRAGDGHNNDVRDDEDVDERKLLFFFFSFSFSLLFNCGGSFDYAKAAVCLYLVKANISK